MSYMTIFSQEKHHFSLCSYFHAHPTTLLLKILGGPMHGPSPHLKFWGGPSPPDPPRSPPLLAYIHVFAEGGETFLPWRLLTWGFCPGFCPGSSRAPNLLCRRPRTGKFWSAAERPPAPKKNRAAARECPLYTSSDPQPP